MEVVQEIRFVNSEVTKDVKFREFSDEICLRCRMTIDEDLMVRTIRNSVKTSKFRSVRKCMKRSNETVL